MIRQLAMWTERRVAVVAFLDLHEAFEIISQSILVAELERYRLNKWTIKWVKKWLGC